MILSQNVKTKRAARQRWPFRGNHEILTVIDIGAYKIACSIVSRARDAPSANHVTGTILGSAAVRSSGIQNGRIVNATATEACLRRVVSKAEAQAKVTAGPVVLTGSFPGLTAEIFEVKPAPGFPSSYDRDTVNAAAADHCAKRQRRLIDVSMRPVATENEAADADSTDTIDIAAISIPNRVALQNEACLIRSLLQPSGFVAGPIAAALAVTSAEERGGSILVLDIGAQSTGCVLFDGGIPLFLTTIPIAGRHLTDDVAKIFSLRRFEAEALKIQEANIFDGLQADIDLAYANGKTGEPISKFNLGQTVREWVTSLFEAVNERLKGSGYASRSFNVVLTGGGSSVPGLRDFAAHALASETRCSKPRAIGGLTGDPSLSALAGACAYVCGHRLHGEMASFASVSLLEGGYASRIGQWLRASF